MTNKTPGKPKLLDAPYAMLFILTLIYVSNAMDRHLIGILAEPIRKDLGLDDTQLGLLSGMVFAFFYTMFGIPAGWLADRFGKVRVITFACMIWSACSALGALSTNFFQLAAARVGVAIGEAGGSAPSYSLISDKFPPEKRGGALGFYHIASPIAILIGVGASGWITAFYGWRAAVLAVSLPGLIFALILAATVSEPPRSARPAGGEPSLLKSIGDFFRHPVLFSIGLTAGLASIGTHAMISWIPAELMRVKGMTLIELGAYYGVTSAIAFGVGVWGGGWICDRFAHKGLRVYALVPALMLLITAPLVVAAALTPGWQMSLIMWMPPVMLGATFLAPAVTLVQNISPPEQRGVFGAIYLLANNLVGAGLGPLVVGMVSDHFEPVRGDASLTYGMLALVPLFIAGSLGQYWVSLRIKANPSVPTEAAAFA